MNRQSNGQTDRQTDRQADRQSDRRTTDGLSFEQMGEVSFKS